MISTELIPPTNRRILSVLKSIEVITAIRKEPLIKDEMNLRFEEDVGRNIFSG